ncbi:MAG: hypothetical protein PF689_10455 [Deltaproteobacteria bacterium]|jgi:hypothetical protein|nr:hypothetical protein [Deltaproteobacteria bacterium]
MNPILFSIFLFLSSQNSPAQVELNFGGGLFQGNPAGKIEVGFDAISDSIGFGLVAPFITSYKNNNFEFYSRGWDSPGDYAHTIRYLSWRGQHNQLKGQIRIGEEYNFTLGNSLLMHHFNNLIFMDHQHSSGSLDLKDDNLHLQGFMNDFVEPEIFGGTLSFNFLSRYKLGASFLLDNKFPKELSDPENMSHSIDIDQERGKLTPFSTTKFFNSSIFANFNFNQYWSAGITLSSLKPDSFDYYGGQIHLEAKFEPKNFKLGFKTSVAGGFDKFSPWLMDSFYLMRRYYSEIDAGQTTLHEKLSNKTNPGWGGNFDFFLGYKDNLFLEGGIKHTDLNSVFHMSGEFIITKKFILAFYGAGDLSKNYMFSMISRISVYKNWYLWGQAKRLFAIIPGNNYYESSSCYLAGIGYKLRTGN